MANSFFTRLLPLFFLSSLLITFHSPIADSQPLRELCKNDFNYTINSTFQANLNSLLSFLSSTTPATGFSNVTKGEDPDRVYGLAECRGDITTDECRTCIDYATQGIVQRCPSRKTAFVWYDHCFLRYSNQAFFTIADTSSVRFHIVNSQGSSDPDKLLSLLGNMMDSLTTRAAYGSSGRMFATGEVNYLTLSKLYSLVECSRDLSGDNCAACLRNIMNDISQFYGSKGFRVIVPSCYLRYELYLFYNISGAGAAPPPLPPTATTTPAALPTATTPPPLLPTAKTTPDALPTATTPPPPSSPVEEGKHNTTNLVLIIVIPVVASLVFFLAIYIWLLKRKALKRKLYVRNEHEITSAESLLFDLGTLKAATNNFSYANKLGEGGFGPVYKGVLLGGQEIAVKRLSRSSVQGLIELRNEVLLVARLQHRNVVRLLGFCLEEQEMLLVYEFLPNSSLDKFLFDPIKCQKLDWGRRYKIIEGICRGLHYLHEDSRLKIIHRDLKAGNILLDEDMDPKIADFGLAKLFEGDGTHGNTNRIAGTYGYMAPEYAMAGQFSSKSDIYSFGVLVLEIVTGRSNIGFHSSGMATDLLSYVWQHWNDGTELQLVDHNLGEQYQQHEVRSCIHIGLLCVQEDALSRPSMSSVLLMLSSTFSATVLPNPSVPAFCVLSSVTTSSKGLQRESVLIPQGPITPQSVNGVTLTTELSPR